jgi:hypothetical protein
MKVPYFSFKKEAKTLLLVYTVIPVIGFLTTIFLWIFGYIG